MRDGQVVKGVRFRDHVVMGDIMDLAARYREEGADELVFYDITASPDGRSVDRRWINRVAEVLDIPFCVAGGIRSIADAEEVLNFGADKISINSREEDDGYRVYQYTGDPDKTKHSGRLTIDWVREVQERGAGEIVLNCMNQDGVRQGYDLPQLRRVREQCTIPLIASGGAGEMTHFADVFREARVDGALAASVFHTAAINIAELKRYLREQNVEIRE